MSYRLIAAVCLLVPGPATAAELGRLVLQSGAGEPLRAEIDVLAVRRGEAATLAARIPPLEVFWRANLEPSPVLDRLRVAVERRPGNHFSRIFMPLKTARLWWRKRRRRQRDLDKHERRVRRAARKAGLLSTSA